MLRGKRGDAGLVARIAIKMVIIFFVFYSFLSVSESFAKNEAFHRQIDAYNAKHMFHAVMAIPDPAYSQFSGDTLERIYDFRERGIEVYTKTPTIETSHIKLYLTPLKGREFTRKFENEKGPLYFSSIGDPVSNLKPDLTILECKELGFKGPVEALSIETGKESLLKSAGRMLQNSAATVARLKTLDSAQAVSGSVRLGIEAGTYPESAAKSPVRAYIMPDSDPSKELACRIVQELMKAYPDATGYSIIPSNRLRDADASAYVRLVVGNTANRGSKMLEDSDENAARLADAVTAGFIIAAG